MSGVDRMVTLLESEDGLRVRGSGDANEALLELLVHIASSDGVIDDHEMEMLTRVLGDRHPTEVRAFVGRIAAKPLDLDDLASHLHTDDQRWTALRFAARMAHTDDQLDPEEHTFLGELAAALDLPADALDRVLREDATRTLDRFEPEALRALLEAYAWGAADFADGAVESGDLVPEVPDDATPVVRIGVDQAEVMGLYAEGMVARFAEGPGWVPWSTIVGFSRGTGLEASTRIHTEDGRVHSIIDPRLAGIQMIFDRMYRKLGDGERPDVLTTNTGVDTWDNE